MKVKCEIVLDLDNNEYEIVFKNMKNNSDEIDYDMVERALDFVLSDWKTRIEDLGVNSSDQILKHFN